MVPAFLHPFAAPGRTDFIRLVGGEGAVVVDEAGRRYVDAIASLWYVNVGHGRTEVIDAVHRQMQALATYNTFEIWTNEPADRLAELIVERAPVADARVFFTNSGSESIDTAIKLARLTHTRAGDADRTLIVSREGGYHGTALAGTSTQGIDANRTGFGPLMPDVVRVGRHDLEEVTALFADRGQRIAAVLTEPLQGASGVHPPVPGYLAGLRRLCDEHGALLVFDEVVTGFGRLGRWFAADHYGVEPDLIVFAKAVTSGYIPMGGVIVGPRVRAALEAEPDDILRTGFTYSGHPTAAAAGIACLEVTEREGLLARASELADRIGSGLRAMQSDGLVADVRGDGAVWGVDLHRGPGRAGATMVRDALIDAGVIVRSIGDGTLALCPPLVITDEEVDRVLDALADQILRSVPAQ
jgi:adenosylmethionine-8-amino-7-oxononanoate aminotransferase